MAYRGKRGYKNNNGRRGRSRRYANNRYNFTYGNVLDKVIGDVARLKGLVNTEFKVLDTPLNGAVTSTMIVQLLNGMIIGDDFDERDGRMIRIKSVLIKFKWFQNQSAVDTAFRVMVIIDKQPNGVLLTVAEILLSSSMHGMKNLDNRKRLVILMDKVFTMSITGKQNGFYKWYKKLDMKTVYDASVAGDITDISTNALYICFMSDEPTNAPTIHRTMRIRFIDN